MIYRKTKPNHLEWLQKGYINLNDNHIDHGVLRCLKAPSKPGIWACKGFDRVMKTKNTLGKRQKPRYGVPLKDKR